MSDEKFLLPEQPKPEPTQPAPHPKEWKLTVVAIVVACVAGLFALGAAIGAPDCFLTVRSEGLQR